MSPGVTRCPLSTRKRRRTPPARSIPLLIWTFVPMNVFVWGRSIKAATRKTATIAMNVHQMLRMVGLPLGKVKRPRRGALFRALKYSAGSERQSTRETDDCDLGCCPYTNREPNATQPSVDVERVPVHR